MSYCDACGYTTKTIRHPEAFAGETDLICSKCGASRPERYTPDPIVQSITRKMYGQPFDPFAMKNTLCGCVAQGDRITLWCPTHAAAPRMKETLSRLTEAATYTWEKEPLHAALEEARALLRELGE